MSAPLTFGDTFTLPATGEDQWRIVDVRPHSYFPPENLTIPGRSEVARAVSANRIARYEVGIGWIIYGAGPSWRIGGAPTIGEAITAQLNALNVNLGHRTDDEWRQLHFKDITDATEYAIRYVVGSGDVPQIAHPLVSNEETIAHITATAAVAATCKPDSGDLYRTVYDATLAAIRA